MRLPLALALLSLATACKKEVPAPTEVKVVGALHAVRCGGVTAEWLGAAPEAPAPKSYGVTGLRFRFPDGTAQPYTPAGALEFSDWSFEVFSPDCARAVLLPDRFGPYQVVATADLPRFLGGAPAALTVGWPKEGPARVHSGLRFTGPDEVEFQAACCGGVDVLRASLADAQRTSVVFSAPEAPHGLRRTEAGYQVAP